MGSKVYQYIIRMRDEATSKLQMLARAAGLADTNISRTAETARRASGSLSGLGSTLRNAAAGYLAFLSVSGSVGWAQSAIQTTAKMQSLENAIVFTSGSAEEGAKSLAFLRAESDRLGLSQEAMTKGFAGFQGSMMGTKFAADEVRKMYSQVSTGAAVMGLDAEAQEGVFRALGQMMGKNKVQAEELRGQLGERMYGAFKIAADGMGLTTEKLDKLMETGKLGSTDFLPRFAAQVQKVFGAGVEKAAQSLQANLSRLDNGFLELKTTFVAQFMPEIMGGVAFLRSDFIPAVKEGFGYLRDAVGWMRENKTMLGQMAVAAGVLAAAYFTLTGAQALAVWWAGASTTAFYAQYIATYGLSGAFAVLNAVMRNNPIGFIITLLAALAAGIIWAWNNVDWFRNGLMGLWEVAKYVFGGIWDWLQKYVVPSLTGLGQVFSDYILPPLMAFWEVIKKVFGWVYDNKQLLLAPFMPLVYLLDKIGAFKGVKAAFDKGYNAGMPGVSETNTGALGNQKDTILGAAGNKDGGKKDGGTNKTLSDISNGGRRSNNITLNVSNKFDIRAGSEREAAKSTAKTFAEELFRELNGAILATNQ